MIFPTLKINGYIVIIGILTLAIGFSLIHLIIFGTGVKFEEDQIDIYEVKIGETKNLAIPIRSFEQEKVKITVEMVTDPNNQKYLKLLENEYVNTAAIPYYYQMKIPVMIKGIAVSNELIHEIDLTLFANGIEKDKKTISIQIKE